MTALLKDKGAFSLAALRMLTSLSASLVIALTAIEADADAETLWSATCLEENWQFEHWGADEEAAKDQRTRRQAFELAMRFAALART
jgi:chaperone required for assembly of F1-ATPase